MKSEFFFASKFEKPEPRWKEIGDGCNHVNPESVSKESVARINRHAILYQNRLNPQIEEPKDSVSPIITGNRSTAYGICLQ